MEQIILFLPLLASITSGFFGKYIGDRSSEIITSLFVSISAILSLILFYNVIVDNYQNNVVIFYHHHHRHYQNLPHLHNR